jgi:hypothetical protein
MARYFLPWIEYTAAFWVTTDILCYSWLKTKYSAFYYQCYEAWKKIYFVKDGTLQSILSDQSPL